MKCVSCNKEIKDNAKFCSQCGAAQTQSNTPDTKTCPKCGATIVATANFCKFCGSQLSANIEQTQNTSDNINAQNKDANVANNDINVLMTNRHITWKILPGQLAVKIDEQEMASYNPINGVNASMPTNDNTMGEFLDKIDKLIEEMEMLRGKETEEEKRRRKEREEREFQHRWTLLHRPQSMTPSLLPYLEPVTPLSNEEFISRIDEFICIQYEAHNGLSGRSDACQLIEEDDPESKERVLSFLKEHPIEKLLYGDIWEKDVFDMTHWEIRFIFADRNLNRRICGYGLTETSYPYLHGLVPILRNNKF